MTCTNNDIKELLPAYQAQKLDKANHHRMEKHMASCPDCKMELVLLRTMIDETVPDPGKAFWNEMPGRVYRAVQQAKKGRTYFDLSWLADRIILPRWVFVAATTIVVLLISLLTVESMWTSQQERGISFSSEYQYSGEIVTDDSLPIADITPEQADAVNTWAVNELTPIGEEVALVVATSADTDISDDIAELNINEAEHFSDMLKQWTQEG